MFAESDTGCKALAPKDVANSERMRSRSRIMRSVSSGVLDMDMRVSPSTSSWPTRSRRPCRLVEAPLAHVDHHLAQSAEGLPTQPLGGFEQPQQLEHFLQVSCELSRIAVQRNITLDKVAPKLRWTQSVFKLT